jgi:hypothetical protein
VQLARGNQRPGRSIVIVALAALGLDVKVDRIRDPLVGATRLMLVKAAALAPPRPVPLASGSGLGRPARRSGLGRLTPIRRSKRLIAVVIGREVQTSTFILPG